MKCDKCNHDAIFHASMYLNGELVEVNLCADHYEDWVKKITDEMKNFTAIGNKEVEKLYRELMDTLNNVGNGIKMDVISGVTGDETLKEYLDKSLKKVKDMNRYDNEISKIDIDLIEDSYFREKIDELNKLRSGMKFLVDRELYEEASDLRDQLKTMNEKLIEYKKGKEQENEA